MDIHELVDNFEYLEEWEDIFRYIIDLGESLPPMPEIDKNDVNKVDGCISQVWLTHKINDDGTLSFTADSDAFIVKGLVAILLIIYNNKSASYIVDNNALDMLAKVGLESHISPNRRNGLVSMVHKITQLATYQLQKLDACI